MDEVASEEGLTRFVFSSSHFSVENWRIRHNAFLPLEGETSVSRITGLSIEDIWEIGEDVAVARKQTLHARGDIQAAKVFAIGLKVSPAEPPPRHAVIVDWPKEKSEQKLKAMELAGSATLTLR